MLQRVVLLSGPVCAGKSRLAGGLGSAFGFELIKTHRLIAARLRTAAMRERLQAAGDRLDRTTDGRWVADDLGRIVEQSPVGTPFVVDSVRIKSQIDAVRQGFGPRVVHVHLTADLAVLASRYEKSRRGSIRELGSYNQVRSNRTERRIEGLADVADVVVRTDRSRVEDVLVLVASRLGLYAPGGDRLVDVLVGGQYGSEGKGQIAAYLAQEYDVLIRVGGPNAGHRVYDLPRPITFHSLPSGALRHEAARLVVGPGAVISPKGIADEINRLGLPYDRLSIDPRAMLIEPYDEAFEAGTLVRSIGSTGRGVGAATSRKVLRNAKQRPSVQGYSEVPQVKLAENSSELKPFIRETGEILEAAYARGQRILLEGTQGSGLSLHHGFYPHVTSRDTTVSGCLSDAGIPPSRVNHILMVCRTYPIRVESPKRGTSGRMGTEITWKEVARRSGVPLKELLANEKTSTTGRRRRVAEFDWTLLRRAALLNGPTDIALTFVDYLSVKNRDARRFEQLTEETIRFVEEVERVALAPVSLIATRFHYRAVIDRRTW